MDKNRVLSGSEGNVWINGDLIGEIKSIEIKITPKYEDVNVCGDYSTGHKYTGWDGDATMTLQKTYDRGINYTANAFKTGIMPDIKIITKLTDKATGQSERVSVSEVVFTELTLAKFESKSLVEEELPFKFSDFEPLETINY